MSPITSDDTADLLAMLGDGPANFSGSGPRQSSPDWPNTPPPPPLPQHTFQAVFSSQSMPPPQSASRDTSVISTTESAIEAGRSRRNYGTLTSDNDKLTLVRTLLKHKDQYRGPGFSGWKTRFWLAIKTDIDYYKNSLGQSDISTATCKNKADTLEAARRREKEDETGSERDHRDTLKQSLDEWIAFVDDLTKAAAETNEAVEKQKKRKAIADAARDRTVLTISQRRAIAASESSTASTSAPETSQSDVEATGNQALTQAVADTTALRDPTGAIAAAAAARASKKRTRDDTPQERLLSNAEGLTSAIRELVDFTVAKGPSVPGPAQILQETPANPMQVEELVEASVSRNLQTLEEKLDRRIEQQDGKLNSILEAIQGLKRQ